MVSGLIHSCTIQARRRQQALAFTAGSGAVEAGQTVSGSASGATAIVMAAEAGSLAVRDLAGAFEAGEEISTPTWSGTLVSQEDRTSRSGEPLWYWGSSAATRCRLYYKGGSGGVVQGDAGQIVTQQLRVMLPASVEIGMIGYRVTTEAVGFAGTYSLVALYPRSGAAGLDHWEAVLVEAA